MRHQLKLTLDTAMGYADGLYSVQAPGCTSAVLRWADHNSPLPDWTAFACVAIDVSGKGDFRFRGGRAIPPQASFAIAELMNGDDLSGLAPCALPAREAKTPTASICFGVASDLHLSQKPWRIRQAFRRMQNTDFVLLVGDLTNDGLPEQFEQIKHCIEEELSGIPVLAVAGNHNFPVMPQPLVFKGVDVWYRMQDWCLNRAEGLHVTYHCR